MVTSHNQSNTTAYDRLIETLHGRGYKVNANGSRAMAQCPAHDDQNPSLSIKPVADGVMVYCHAGCDTKAVAAALNLTMADLFNRSGGTCYQYPGGREVIRTPDKKFRQRGNLNGSTLFASDEIAGADTVYVVEGEKDVLAVQSVWRRCRQPTNGRGYSGIALGLVTAKG